MSGPQLQFPTSQATARHGLKARLSLALGGGGGPLGQGRSLERTGWGARLLGRLGRLQADLGCTRVPRQDRSARSSSCRGLGTVGLNG